MGRAGGGWAASLGLCCLAALLAARGASGQDDDDRVTVSDVDAGIDAGAALMQGASDPPDPFAEIEEAAMTQPALTHNQLNLQFTEGHIATIEVQVGDIPAEVAAAFAQEHGMEPVQERLAARALGRAQLDHAMMVARQKSEADELSQPALVHVTLNVKQSEDGTDEPKLAKLSPGQSPQQAAAEFAAQTGINSDAQFQIAQRLAADHSTLIHKVAAEHIKAVNTTSHADYVIDRMMGVPATQLSHKDLRRIIEAAEALIETRKLISLHVETSKTAADVEPAQLSAFEGDDVNELIADFATAHDLTSQQSELVRGAVLITFYRHKGKAEERVAAIADGRIPADAPLPATEAWYDLRTDSFKEPRPWEANGPPRGKPLFQLQYSPFADLPDHAAANDKSTVNVTVYDGDLAIELGEHLATHFSLPESEGWAFAHYVATAFRRVSDKLNTTEGARPWEGGQIPAGMALFRLQLDSKLVLDQLRNDPSSASSEAADAIASRLAGKTVVVHEGDSPNALAAGVCAHFGVAQGSSNARSLAVTGISDHITDVFANYFGPVSTPPPPLPSPSASLLGQSSAGGDMKVTS